MKIKVISILVGVIGTLAKSMEKVLSELEASGRIHSYKIIAKIS